MIGPDEKYILAWLGLIAIGIAIVVVISYLAIRFVF